MLRHFLIGRVLIISICCASRAWAVDFFWTGPGFGGPGGNFQNSDNWTFTPPPFPLEPAPGGADDTVNFDLGRDPENRYTVTNVNGENDQLLIHDDSLRLEINSYQLLSTDEASPSFIVGVTGGDEADVILRGVSTASLRTKDVVLGLGVASSGAVRVDHLQWANDGPLFVGGRGQFVGDTGGDGILEIVNGSQVASDSGRIGSTLGSIGEVLVTDATWSITESLSLGGQGIGTLSVQNGGTVSSGFGFIGSNSAATIDGAGSEWTIDGGLAMFQGAGAVLNIENGGTVTVGLNEFNTMTANSSSEITLDSGGVLDVRTGIILNTGTFNFLGGTLHVAEFDGNLVNQGGTLAPGHSDQPIGDSNVTGNYTHQAAATLQIEIGGTAAGTQHDFVNIEGTASVAGSLELALANEFVPAPDDEFVVFITDTLWIGSFSNVADGQRLPLASGLGSFVVHYGPTSMFNANQVVLTDFLTALPGDYNQNGIVDAADFTLWRDHLGQTFTLTNENPAATTPGLVDTEDYAFWKANFGQSLGSGSAATYLANTAVPEPSPLILLMLGLSLFLRRAIM